MSIRIGGDKSPNDLPFRVVAIALFISSLATAVTMVGCCLTIDALGLKWSGELFGGGTFNWKDGLVKLACAPVFGVVSGAIIRAARRTPRRGFDVLLSNNSVEQNSARSHPN